MIDFDQTESCERYAKMPNRQYAKRFVLLDPFFSKGYVLEFAIFDAIVYAAIVSNAARHRRRRCVAVKREWWVGGVGEVEEKSQAGNLVFKRMKMARHA